MNNVQRGEWVATPYIVDPQVTTVYMAVTPNEPTPEDWHPAGIELNQALIRVPANTPAGPNFVWLRRGEMGDPVRDRTVNVLA
jgi:hypothetical protein